MDAPSADPRLSTIPLRPTDFHTRVVLPKMTTGLKSNSVYPYLYSIFLAIKIASWHFLETWNLNKEQ